MTSSTRWGGMKGVAVGIMSLVLLVPLSASAFVFRTGDQVTVPLSETVSKDLYAAGGNVSVTGLINGDLIAGGGTVVVNGAVSKSAMLSGGTITVVGNIAESVRAAGGTVVINGAVGNDVVAVGGSVILNGSKVGGDVAIGGGTVEINSPVAGNVHIAGGTVRINAPIGGSLDVKGGKITLGSAAVITGSFSYTATEKATMDPGAKVLGETKFTQVETTKISKSVVAGLVSLFALFRFLSILIASLLFGLIFKKYAETLCATALSSPLSEFGRGAIAMIVLPIASVILIATLIGIPIGIIGLLSFIILMIFSAIATPIVIGSFIHKKWRKPEGYLVSWKTIAGGVVVYFALGFIPILGWLAILIASLITVGAIVKMKMNILKVWR